MATASPSVTHSADENRRRAHRTTQWSFPILVVRGIQLRIHLTFVFLVALVAWLASLSGGPGTVAVLVWIGLLFGSVIVHEFAHSLVARRRGITVHEILLLPIGGVSKLEALPEKWNDEFAISIAGPLTSLAIGTASIAVAALLGEPLGTLALGGSVLVALGWMNLILAGFNLLPAFPLDGGRVLRSMLERQHDRATATRQAARIGRALAVAMMVVGVLLDWWLILIGVFVYFGATAEERATLIHIQLAPLHVRDVFVEVPITFHADQHARDVAPLVMHSLQSIFPVLAADGYRGAVTRGGVMAAAPETLCGEMTDSSIPVVAPEAPVEDVLEPLLAAPSGIAVVVSGRAVVGILRTEDLQRLLSTRPLTEGPSEKRLVLFGHMGKTSSFRKD
ncbi:MAG: site-2 protease family protein [Acidimicrobiia bacterium]